MSDGWIRESFVFYWFQVIGHSNFSSIRATTCVYKGEYVFIFVWYLKIPQYIYSISQMHIKVFLRDVYRQAVDVWTEDCVLIVCAGKWVYEVLISSQGLMQIGWCTLNCHFNQEVHTHTLTYTHTQIHGGIHTHKHTEAQTDTQRHRQTPTHTDTHWHTRTHTGKNTSHKISHHECRNTLHFLFSICATTDQVHGSITASLMQSLWYFIVPFDIPGGCWRHPGLVRLRREQSPQVERDDNQLWQGQERPNQRDVQYTTHSHCVFMSAVNTILLMSASVLCYLLGEASEKLRKRREHCHPLGRGLDQRWVCVSVMGGGRHCELHDRPGWRNHHVLLVSLSYTSVHHWPPFQYTTTTTTRHLKGLV